MTKFSFLCRCCNHNEKRLTAIGWNANTNTPIPTIPAEIHRQQQSQHQTNVRRWTASSDINNNERLHHPHLLLHHPGRRTSSPRQGRFFRHAIRRRRGWSAALAGTDHPVHHAGAVLGAGRGGQRPGLLHLLPEEGQDDLHPLHSLPCRHGLHHLSHFHPLHDHHRGRPVSVSCSPFISNDSSSLDFAWKPFIGPLNTLIPFLLGHKVCWNGADMIKQVRAKKICLTNNPKKY